eukprot:CAMPEP_0117546598 /NCGR_PEP_ID=MMETSP0784-20121206/46687_1 /TAXON_ID=39447 /ORGANISM="" /LENGTH=263 /DNA_ID=CAMNT_0005343469 /DNA_START=1 /DNA_END=792 /DNA_ORIENTATION=-
MEPWRYVGMLASLLVCAPLAASQGLQKVMSSDQMIGIHVLMDANKDGLISKEEGMAYVHGLRSQMSVSPAMPIIEAMDLDKDGHVTLVEFRNDLQGLRLDDTEKSQLASMFLHFDRDGDERLSPAEITPLISWTYKSKKLDLNDDGRLSLKEFREVAKPKLQGISAEEKAKSKAEGKTIFKKLDADGDKYLSPTEFFVYHSGIFAGQEALLSLLGMADSDADQHISVDELVEVRGSPEFGGSSAYHHITDWIQKAGLPERAEL